MTHFNQMPLFSLEELKFTTIFQRFYEKDICLQIVLYINEYPDASFRLFTSDTEQAYGT